MNKNPNMDRSATAHGDKLDHLQRFEDHIKSLGRKNLDLVLKKLNFLCLDFDPYSDGMSQEAENLIEEFELSSYCSNPFDFTNVILQMLDKVENLKKSREH
jgi:hypothetical protein